MNYLFKGILGSTINFQGAILCTLMRLLVLVLSISTVQASTYAQVKIDFDIEAATVEEFLSELQSKTGFHFFYRDDVVGKEMAGPINLRNVTIDEILNEAFKNTALGYKIDNRQVVVKRLEKKSANEVVGLLDQSQQDFVVRGTVTNETGEGLPGVSVVIMGSAKGVQTNIDGTYELAAEPGSMLSFSFVGMETQTVRVGESSTIDVVLKQASSFLEEVILVGYGQETKESLVGSVSVVKNSDLRQVPVATFEQSMRGSVAGLQASAIDGAPGSNTQIRIRGTGSISASSEPLYVVDGIPVNAGDMTSINGNGGRSGNVMTSLNPNDIESISVLKDAAATAIYGSRGANGVILVTTKSGKSGAPKITFSTLVGLSSPAYKNILKPLNAKQYIQLFLEGNMNNGDTYEQAHQKLIQTFPQAFDPVTGDTTDTNWLDAISRVGVTQSYDLSASGGTDNLTYYFSGAYYDQKNYIIGSDFRRMNARANLEYKARKNITVSNNMFVSNSLQHTFPDAGSWENPLKNAIELPPLIPIYDEAGRYNTEHRAYFPLDANPVGGLNGDNIREIKQLRVMDNLAVTWKIFDHFSFRSQWNFDIINLNEYLYETPRYGNAYAVNGSVSQANTLNTNWVGTQTLGYVKELAPRHNLNVLVGYEAQKSRRESFSAIGKGFPNEKLRTLNSTSSEFGVSGSGTEYSFIAMFAKADYNFNHKYFVSSSIRRDGSSRFGPQKRWGTFYSIGGGWVISNESFMSDLKALSFLRLRSSWGLTGNAAIGNFSYAGLYTYGQDYDGNPGGSPSQIGNPDLTWETQKNFNIGLDFDLFNRMNGTVEYFNRTSSDLILDVPISLTTGFQSLTQNYGEMVNKGLEITLSANLITKNSFTWDFGLNYTIINNEITKLTSDFIDGTFIRRVGGDFQSYYMYNWAGVDPSNGKPQWYADESKNEVVNNPGQAKRFYDGKTASPDFFGGFNTAFAYKGFTLNADFMYSYGNYNIDARARGLVSDGRLTPRSTAVIAFENRWVPGKTDALWPQHRWGGQPGSNEQFNSRWVFDGSFVRMKNLTLAYTLPESLTHTMNLSSVRVYLRGTNLLTFVKDKNSYIDPEQSINGTSDAMTPQAKTFSVGLDIGL